MKAAVLFSGGMDSTTLLYEVIHMGLRPVAITFTYGQKSIKELEFAKALVRKLEIQHIVIHFPALGEMARGCALTDPEIPIPEGIPEDDLGRSVIVPNRNMIFISVAASYCLAWGVRTLFTAVNREDAALSPDCSPAVIDAMKKALEACDHYPITLRAPYLQQDKLDILRIGQTLGVDYSLTWSCYSGEDRPCGRCASCLARRSAFERAGMKDPLECAQNRAPSR
ncbi:MAG: 7-cyano-7-deazaguanine synthase QueC [Methanomicrobiales archaeon]|nr:7-cyano-7-deazaguanine synthase QueC [Methanomicrobiales archaeon]MDI6875370.1 7-cyano-7-deazaguanine synthase QueC [Methanomicrobiales archaeon]